MEAEVGERFPNGLPYHNGVIYYQRSLAGVRARFGPSNRNESFFPKSHAPSRSKRGCSGCSIRAVFHSPGDRVENLLGIVLVRILDRDHLALLAARCLGAWRCTLLGRHVGGAQLFLHRVAHKERYRKPEDGPGGLVLGGGRIPALPVPRPVAVPTTEARNIDGDGVQAEAGPIVIGQRGVFVVEVHEEGRI